MAYRKEQLKKDLRVLGVCPGDAVMMHFSYKALGEVEEGAQGIFDAIVELLGEEGTLLVPGFSWNSVDYEHPVFDRDKTPSCVGYLPEYFRTHVNGYVRSMHATHSVCVLGKHAEALVKDHEKDLTPVGKNSPIMKLAEMGGKILMLGCSPDHLTIMHGVEETAEPPYLFDREKPIEYILRDGDAEMHQTAIRHSFEKEGYRYGQVYSRILNLLDEGEYSHGMVLAADSYLFSASAIVEKGHKKLLEDPYYFVNKTKI